MMQDITTKTFTGAGIIVETLKKLGVDTIFGYPGGIVLKLYDELSSQDSIKHYLVRHEQAAVHAAEGYARVSGKCGVVLVTSGPGATNTISGIVNAYLDGYPLVVLTGQVSAELIGKNAFQEADICDMTKSCAKKTFQVTDIRDLQRILEQAFAIANSGKKGPVVVDLAKNIFTETFQFSNYSLAKIEENFMVEGDFRAVLNKLVAAQKPVIVAGGGVILSDAEKELFKLAKSLEIPVVDTMMGLGSFPQSDENYLGMIGIFGDFSANQVMRESDLIFSIGARFNDRITSCFNVEDFRGRFIQLDINEKEFSKNIPAMMTLRGDAKNILELMNDEISFRKPVLNKSLRTIWKKETELLKSKNAQNVGQSNNLQSYEVISEINKFITSFNPVITTEVGQHQLWAAKNFTINSPRKFLTSGGSGTMGFGFPAAIGATIANGLEPVVCIAGDGSFQMNMQELATCVDYHLPVKIMILNNGYLGMVRQLQDKMCEGRYSETKISNPDFVKLAECYGLKAVRVTKREEIQPALEVAFADKGTFIIDFVVEPFETV